jgi:hypothetical protein
MTTSAQLIERHPGVVDLALRNRAGISAYRVGSAVSLDAAYAGTTELETILQGRTFRSRTLKRNGINFVQETNRGLTRVTYDPVDYASATVPGDTDISFVRIAEVDGAGTVLPEGPILVVPPPGFFAFGRAVLNLNGTAPDVAGRANNLPPADAMRVDLPKLADEVTIFNDDAVSLFIAFDLGTQEIEVPAGESLTFVEAGVSEIFLRGGGAVAIFRLISALVNGIQA